MGTAAASRKEKVICKAVLMNSKELDTLRRVLEIWCIITPCSKEQKQMLLWACCCEQEGLSWSDQLWCQPWRSSKQVGESQKRAERISCFGDYDELVGLVYLVKER